MAETPCYEEKQPNPGKTVQASNVRLRGEVWYGNASWYGGMFHGKKTSSGEKYNKRELTAAHRFLPFNTHVIVTNLQNNKSVIVRINDRGPFSKNRIIDLSEEAAKLIDGKKQGITYVKVQVLPHFEGFENWRIGELRNQTFLPTALLAHSSLVGLGKVL